MRLTFQIGDASAEFTRDFWMGRAELRVGDEVLGLASPTRLGTHLSTSLRKEWRVTVGDHLVSVVKIRPLFLGGVRPNTYVISVDDRVVVEGRGF